jgi:large subunit ribosomal protein L16
MLRVPIATKFKHMHHRYHFFKKGNKGFKYAGLYILKARETHIFTPNLVEIIRRLLNKRVRDSYGELDIRIFPSYPCSKKPLQSRMGKGKGRPSHFITPIYKGAPIVCIHKDLEFHKLRPFIKRLVKRLPIAIKQRFFPKGRDQLDYTYNLKSKQISN